MDHSLFIIHKRKLNEYYLWLVIVWSLALSVFLSFSLSKVSFASQLNRDGFVGAFIRSRYMRKKQTWKCDQRQWVIHTKWMNEHAEIRRWFYAMSHTTNYQKQKIQRPTKNENVCMLSRQRVIKMWLLTLHERCVVSDCFAGSRIIHNWKFLFCWLNWNCGGVTGRISFPLFQMSLKLG